jgi:hypothetical protein
MTWSIGTVTFLVGLALMVLGILGGGLEIKEVKIPSMGRLARAISFAIGAGLLALSLMTPEYLHRLSSNLTASSEESTGSVTGQDKSFYLFNVLDPGQESEKVEVIIEGKSVGLLDIDKVKTTAGITYKTKKEAVSYKIKGAQIYKFGTDVRSFQLIGDGILQVVDGARYRLWVTNNTEGKKTLAFRQDVN